MNPILQRLNNQNPGRPQEGNLVNRLMNAKNPDSLYQDLMSNNEQFRSFVTENRGKSPEEIARRYGVNINPILGMLR